MKEGIKSGLRKTKIPVCVATPLLQQTCDTISKLQQKYMVYQSYDNSRIKVPLTPKISARRPQFLPLSFLHPATLNNGALQKVHLQVGQMIAQELDFVDTFSLLLRANLLDVPKIHSQIFINSMTTNVAIIHKKL